MLAILSMFGMLLAVLFDTHVNNRLNHDNRECLANQDELLVDLGSDQTSCHNPYHGGYYPVQVRQQ
jgi:hypothetical protein